MQFDAHCINCIVQRHFELVEPKNDGEKAFSYMRDVMRIMLEAPKNISASYLTCEFSQAYAKYWPGDDPYAKLKKDSNDMILDLLPQIRPMVEQADDPLSLAMKFARTGNFLDFGILTPEVAHKALWEAVEKTPSMELDPEIYSHLLDDLSHAKQLLILGDNAGEIVFDILLVEQLRKQYPELEILYCVRGKNALNDATREDAAYVGMDKLVQILDNGTGISGTELDYICDELKQVMATADVILSKGSGNMESLAGCGYNIYYCFLIKCDLFIDTFQKPKLTPMLVRELGR